MLYLLSVILLPPLLVFGLYHLLTWVNPLRVAEAAHWKRVAAASAMAHIFLATGFFVFLYYEYLINRTIEAEGFPFGVYLFNRSGFWPVMTAFDTLAMVAILVSLALLDRFGVNMPQLVALTIAITYLAGTFQWFWIGGGVGALLEKLWSGLKTVEEEDEDWL